MMGPVDRERETSPKYNNISENSPCIGRLSSRLESVNGHENDSDILKGRPEAVVDGVPNCVIKSGLTRFDILRKQS